MIGLGPTGRLTAFSHFLVVNKTSLPLSLPTHSQPQRQECANWRRLCRNRVARYSKVLFPCSRSLVRLIGDA